MDHLPSDAVTQIKARLDHPIIDSDGHAIEYLPLVRDILRAHRFAGLTHSCAM